MSKDTSTVSALYNAGIASTGNSTSTTGPVTRATRPTPVVVSVVAVISFLFLRFRIRWSYAERASAPPTISLISWVISAWRAWLA